MSEDLPSGGHAMVARDHALRAPAQPADRRIPAAAGFLGAAGRGLKASFRPSGMPGDINYMQYFYPGMIILVLLFTAIFATISTVEDRKEGFLQGVLVAPIARSTVVLGQALGATTLALIQGSSFWSSRRWRGFISISPRLS